LVRPGNSSQVAKGGSEFQVQDEDEDGPEAEKTKLQQPGARGLRAKANLKPYVTLVSRAQGRGRGQARADGDDDDDDDGKEAEDRTFSDTGVRLEAKQALQPYVTLVSLDRRNKDEDRTSEQRRRRRRRTREGSQEDKDPRQARSRVKVGA